MSIYILRLANSEIIGAREAVGGLEIPLDSISVSKELFDLYGTILQSMRADGRIDRPIFINSSIETPLDNRVLISVELDKDRYKVDELISITISLVGGDAYSGEQMLTAFDDLYLFDFINGVSLRNDISLSKSGVYEFKNNATIRVSTPKSITIYK